MGSSSDAGDHRTISETNGHPIPPDWLGAWLPHLAAIAGLVGLIAYVVLRIVYATFYDPLGVRPEEVGLGYLELLSQSAGSVLGLAVWFLLLASVLILAATALIPGWLVIVAVAGPRLSWPRSTSHGPKRPSVVWKDLLSRDSAVRRVLRLLTWGTFLITVLVYLWLLHGEARADSSAIAMGLPARPTLWQFNLAAWGGQVATVTAGAGSDLEPLLSELEGHCLLYLGEAKGKAVFYDAGRALSLRLPSAELAISVLPYPQTGPDCPPD
jgi:hypothetical protein